MDHAPQKLRVAFERSKGGAQVKRRPRRHRRSRSPFRSFDTRDERSGDGLEKLRGTDRLGDVGVHAGGQAALAVAFHRVRGEGDDWDVGVGCPLLARMAFVAANPSMFGICTSIKIKSKGSLSQAARAAFPSPASTGTCPHFFRRLATSS